MKPGASLLAALFASALLLAGCSDAPPSGDLAAGAADITLSGDATFTYQEEVRPTPADVGGNPNPLYEQACAEDPAPVGQCTEPMTMVEVMLHEAPEPNPNGYTAWLVGGASDPTELEVGAVAMEEGMYTANNSWGVDYTNHFAGIEVRMGESVVLATAGTASGANPFAVAENLGGVSVTGSYEGKTLTFDVSGLPDNGTFEGWLVGIPEGADDAAPLEHIISIPGVVNGPNEFKASKNINAYAEFHIHVAGSKINVYHTAIE